MYLNNDERLADEIDNATDAMGAAIESMADLYASAVATGCARLRVLVEQRLRELQVAAQEFRRIALADMRADLHQIRREVERETAGQDTPHMVSTAVLS